MKLGGIEKLSLIDFPETLACIIYTVGCNFACPYCHNPELVNETIEEEISSEFFFKFLDGRKGLLEGVVITGGEPTLHGDLLDFIKEIKNRGFKVKLDSNGTNPELLRKAFDQNLLDYIAMDIKAPLVDYHEAIARPVNRDDIRESIDLIMNSGVPYEFRTTIVKSILSPEDIENILREIKGAHTYYLQKFIPTRVLNPQFRKKVTYSDEEFSGFVKIAKGYVENCYVR